MNIHYKIPPYFANLFKKGKNSNEKISCSVFDNRNALGYGLV